jgi:oxygen-independent coproporphyrinogen-3 oxidase
MYALPQQTLEEALHDVTTACALEPTHISYYQLTLEPGTVFHAKPPQLPDEESAWQIQLQGQALLAAAGYAQYEVSAYARPGAACRHNLNYWLFGDYVGIGAGAHGKLSLALPQHIVRTTKPKQPREYQTQVRARANAGERAPIPLTDLPFEFMLNALRLNQGFTALDYCSRTGLEMASVEGRLTDGERRGLLSKQPDGWRATELGFRFLNDLQASFLA